MLSVFRRLRRRGSRSGGWSPSTPTAASDFRSIEADNTSAFNCRTVDGTSRWSEHAYGRAIDLNPIENPYVGSSGTTSHRASTPYLRPRPYRPGMAVEGGTVVARLRRDRLGLGRPLVGAEGLPALLRERPVTGAFALAAGGVLLAAGSLRVAAQLAPRSTASFLLGAYVVAWAQLIAVLWVLSLFGWVTRWALLAGLALVCVAILVDRRGWKDVVARLRDGASALRRALDEPLCAVLGVAVLVAFGYALALGLATPQNDFDTVFDHLWRAALWRENQAVGYPDCDCAPYVNAYPPHGEMGVLATMVLGGSDRFATLVQAAAFVALAVGVVGVARGLGLARREALLGALLVATLPVIALQASTAQNDLVVASFLVASAAFLLDTGPGAPWLAGGATALAIGTKVSAVFGLPVLVVVALVAAPSRRGQRLVGVLGGGAVGAYWYVVNWAEGGSWDAGFPYEAVDRGVADTVARALRSAIQLIELPGGGGRDRWLYLVAAAILFVGLAVAYRRRSAVTAVGSGAAAALVAVLPVLTPDVRRYADQAYLELWRAVGRDDLAVDVGRDITRSASNVTWYGPLGACSSWPGSFSP